jgi:hypothetical protein
MVAAIETSYYVDLFDRESFGAYEKFRRLRKLSCIEIAAHFVAFHLRVREGHDDDQEEKK